VEAKAACIGMADLFIGPESEPTDRRRRRENEAKAICAGCPRRDDCLAEAMRNRERHGVWGGTTPEERRELARALRVS
jgi:WhiB family transcriptional regulator, redox-sensing transcriptional regulator